MVDSIQEKIFINSNNMGIFSCPRCKRERLLDVSEHTGKSRAVKFRYNCPCGHSRVLLLERRKAIRKGVDIPGFYIKKEETGYIKRPVIIRDLSCTGLKFEVTASTPYLKKEEILLIEFNLDNAHKTPINKDVRVRNISGRQIGVEYCSMNLSNPVDRAYNMALAFYTTLDM